jgi:hypothetical protein
VDVLEDGDGLEEEEDGPKRKRKKNEKGGRKQRCELPKNK